jgi:hypothetical protein
MKLSLNSWFKTFSWNFFNVKWELSHGKFVSVFLVSLVDMNAYFTFLIFVGRFGFPIFLYLIEMGTE